MFDNDWCTDESENLRAEIVVLRNQLIHRDAIIAELQARLARGKNDISSEKQSCEMQLRLEIDDLKSELQRLKSKEERKSKPRHGGKKKCDALNKQITEVHLPKIQSLQQELALQSEEVQNLEPELKLPCEHSCIQIVEVYGPDFADS